MELFRLLTPTILQDDVPKYLQSLELTERSIMDMLEKVREAKKMLTGPVRNDSSTSVASVDVEYIESDEEISDSDTDSDEIQPSTSASVLSPPILSPSSSTERPINGSPPNSIKSPPALVRRSSLIREILTKEAALSEDRFRSKSTPPRPLFLIPPPSPTKEELKPTSVDDRDVPSKQLVPSGLVSESAKKLEEETPKEEETKKVEKRPIPLKFGSLPSLLTKSATMSEMQRRISAKLEASAAAPPCQLQRSNSISDIPSSSPPPLIHLKKGLSTSSSVQKRRPPTRRPSLVLSSSKSSVSTPDIVDSV
ncbi:hypothetical protein PROFUN_15570 [Planoprotostelium fungivorum]|uniref:Uncharacterized protein n=1 Tax=Planoprotostelium fungivorum TaxID=1890364 RepID=A0A2P6MZ46_9EUKA|nr:hypothetical protein PROFUN_15570 [Planoprotostelium fungivorum]